MPKDEFDLDDPMELTGVGLLTDTDTTDTMCECFIEEFLRMGFTHQHILALFRNPYYVGPHLVWKGRGEAFVQERIVELFAAWGRQVHFPQAGVPATAGPRTIPLNPASGLCECGGGPASDSCRNAAEPAAGAGAVNVPKHDQSTH